MRRTKIVCTIGPKTNSYEALEELAAGGMNVARLNMSHGTHEWHRDVINKVKSINEKGELSVAIMLDTKGPEMRSGDLKQSLVLAKGDQLILTVRREPEYPKNCIEVNYDGFVDDVEIGDTLLVDSGMINLKVVEKTHTDVILECLDGGTMTSRRHLNILGKSANLPPITDKDWTDIDFGIAEGVDFIALSFANSGPVVTELKKYLTEKNSAIEVISKIESTAALKNMIEIVDASDGIMVARGDLGAEIPVEDVPQAQREIVKYCRKVGKPVIVATQLLESMMLNPTPTRAEVTDIFYAVRQRADAIMMSGETANGNYPFKALETMAKVANKTEEQFQLDKRITVESSDKPKSEIALGACTIANNIEAKAILVFTRRGSTAGLISQCRPNSPIYAFTNTPGVRRKLHLFWGVSPFRVEFSSDPEKTIERAIDILKRDNLAGLGDRIVVVSDILVNNEFVETIQLRVVR